MAADHLVKLRFDIAHTGETMIADRHYASVAEVVKVISEFVTEFGEPDAGTQTISVSIVSTRT